MSLYEEERKKKINKQKEYKIKMLRFIEKHFLNLSDDSVTTLFYLSYRISCAYY